MRMPLLGPVLPLGALPHAPGLPGTVGGSQHGLAVGHAGRAAAAGTGPFGRLLRAGAGPAGGHEDRGGDRRAHDGDVPDAKHAKDPGRDDALDPAARQAAQLAPPLPPPPAAPPPPVAAPAAAGSPPARASLEDLLPALVRRVAWSGDARRGTVRMELGAGSLSGATLLVQSDQGRVEVRLSVPPGVDAEAWRARIASRLAARGLEVDAIEVI